MSLFPSTFESVRPLSTAPHTTGHRVFLLQSQRYKQNIMRARCSETVLQMVSCSCMLCSGFTVCPRSVSTFISCTVHGWHYNCYKNWHHHEESRSQIQTDSSVKTIQVNCDILWMQQTRYVGLCVLNYLSVFFHTNGPDNSYYTMLDWKELLCTPVWSSWFL